jgi:hypothetical protein
MLTCPFFPSPESDIRDCNNLAPAFRLILYKLGEYSVRPTLWRMEGCVLFEEVKEDHLIHSCTLIGG